MGIFALGADQGSQYFATLSPETMNSSRNCLNFLGIVVLLAATVCTSPSPATPPRPRALPPRPGPDYYDRCREGPSYWCRNYDNMYECGRQAYDHCTGSNQYNPDPYPDPYLYYKNSYQCRNDVVYVCTYTELRRSCDLSILECLIYAGIQAGSSTPGSSAPGSSAPGSSRPGSSAPGSSRPGSSPPGASRSSRPRN